MKREQLEQIARKHCDDEGPIPIWFRDQILAAMSEAVALAVAEYKQDAERMREQYEQLIYAMEEAITLAVVQSTERYEQLIYAVACKFPGESRHETALRYIRERENREGPAAADAARAGRTESDK